VCLCASRTKEVVNEKGKKAGEIFFLVETKKGHTDQNIHSFADVLGCVLFFCTCVRVCVCVCVCVCVRVCVCV
jgi:hypothetical protein